MIKLGTKVRVLKCEHGDVLPGTVGVVIHSYHSPLLPQGIGVEIEQFWKDAWGKAYKTKEIVFVEFGNYEEVK